MFYTDLGYAIENIGSIEYTLIGYSKLPNEYVFQISVDGKHMSTSTNSSYNWLNIRKRFIDVIKEMFPSASDVSISKIGLGKFRYLNCLSEDKWGYEPGVLYDVDSGAFRIGRIYAKNGDYGAYPNKDIVVGNYGFDCLAFVNIS